MEEVGVVQKVDTVYATVLVEKKSVCDSCTQGCKMSSEGAEIEALNTVKAQVGQTVKVRMQPFAYMKGSLLVYGLPALALIAGAVIGREWLSQLIKSIDKDLLSAIAGFAALFLAFVFVKILSARAEKKMELKPVIEEILSK